MVAPAAVWRRGYGVAALVRVGVIAALAAVAALLLVSLVAGERDRGGTAAERVVPDFDQDAITGLEIRRSDEQAVRLERGDDGGFAMTSPRRVAADPRAVGDLLGALEMVAVQRRGEAGRELGEPDAELRVEFSGERRMSLAIGDEIEISDQVWMARGEEVFLVEGHYARALAPSATDLADGRPLREVAEATALTVETDRGRLEIELGPPAFVVLPEGRARADSEAVRDVVRAVRELEFELDAEKASAGGPASEGGVPAAAASLAIAAEGEDAWFEVVGACGGGARVVTSAGRGCADAGDVAAVAELADEPEALVLPPFARAWREVGSDGAITAIDVKRGDESLELRREDGGFSGPGGRVSPARVRELLRKLAERTGEPRPIFANGGAEHAGGAPAATGRPAIAIELIREGGDDEVIHMVRGDGSWLAARADEPVAFTLRGDASELITATEHDFEPRALVTREPHALRSLRRTRPGAPAAHDAEVIARGQLIGEYEVKRPAGRVLRGAATERAASAIARLRASRFASERPTPGQGLDPPLASIEAEFDPPPRAGAAAETVVIEVGAEAAGGCYARKGDAPVAVIPAETCEALTAPWTDAEPP